MKIIFDQNIFCIQQYGGISRYVYELAQGLTTICKQNVLIIAPFYINQYLKNSLRQFYVLGLPFKKIVGAGRILAIINFIIAFPIIRLMRPDIVHETYYAARRIAPINSKVILTVYDMIDEIFSDHTKIKNTKIIRDKALAVARADHIICISEQTRKDLIEILGVDQSKTSVVYLGFKHLQINNIHFPFVAPMRPYFLYVGDRGGYKNFKRLVEAYASSKKLKSFVIICFGGGEFTAEEKKLFDLTGLSVDLVQQVSGGDHLLASYYKNAFAFIYPSLYEGFGIPPLEAMSFECPVVCSNVSSIPEVVGDAGLMFDPYDSNAIRLAIEQIVDDCTFRDILISRGKERIKHFSWERCSQETLKVYKKVLG